ncbi:UbiA family prenyltransferase [Gemmatimonas sp.]
MTLNPLCVDLDGTLSHSDSTWDMIAKLFTSRPVTLLRIVLRAYSDRARLKHLLLAEAGLEAEQIPLRSDLVAWLKQEAECREVWLVSGAPQKLVDAVASHVGCFTGAVGSTSNVNLTEERKRDLLVERFGHGRFDYVGNSVQDLVVWESASRRLAYGVDRRLSADLARRNVEVRSWRPPFPWIRALRPAQWSKNLLVLVPLLASHSLSNPEAWRGAVLALVALCLGSSAVYVANDLHDIQHDRAHARKRHRPLASGTLPVPVALILLLGCLTAWLALFVASDAATARLLILQMGLSVTYTIWLKAIPLVDVFALALLYGNRIAIGSSAEGIPVTAWLVAFAFFVFTALASLKRYSELRLTTAAVVRDLPGRGYRSSDAGFVFALGFGSGLLAVLVLALYITQPETRRLYPNPSALWGACLVIFHSLTRLWLLAWRGETIEDPLDFVFRDRASWVALGVLLLTITFAAWSP